MQTPVDLKTPIDLKTAGETLVYVKPVKVADLPRRLQDQADGLDEIYAVHDTKGEQIALVAEEAMAFALARDNNMSPVSVH